MSNNFIQEPYQHFLRKELLVLLEHLLSSIRQRLIVQNDGTSASKKFYQRS